MEEALDEVSGRNQYLRHELDACVEEHDQLWVAVREICSCVLGTLPSSPLQDDLHKVPRELDALTALAAYHGASSALSAVVSRHPELDLGSLEGGPSTGRPYDDALVLAGKLEPIAAKVAQGLPFVAVRADVRRVERELEVDDGVAGAMASTSSTGGSVAPSSGVDPSSQK